MQKDLEQEYRAKQKKELQEKSKARVSNWPNTLEATRKKREEDKLRQMDESDSHRVAVSKFMQQVNSSCTCF